MGRARYIRSKIDSIEGTRKITEAMELIASSRIREAQKRILEARPFINEIEDFIKDLALCYSPEIDDPLMRVHKEQNKVLLVGITSDRGLCGGYNSNILKLIESKIREIEAEGKEVELVIIGTRGKSYFEHAGVKLSKAYEHLSEHPKFLDAREISKEIIKRYVLEEINKVIICYTKFISPVEQIPTAQQILPIPIEGKLEEEKPLESKIEGEKIDRAGCRLLSDMLFDPSYKDILGSLLPQYLYTIVYGALLESTASEIGARMTAMRNASDNADEMLSELTREYHRERQQEITLEIVEVISAAEAIKEEKY